MVYEYQCTNSEVCGAVTERTQRMADERPASIPCKYCGVDAKFKISAPAVLTGNMANQTFDVAVGRDAARRWDAIHARQAQRDKVRRETNQAGLQATGYNEFRPIPEAQRQVRTQVTQAVERDGFRSETGN